MDDAGVPAFTGLSVLRCCFVPWSHSRWREEDACEVAGMRASCRLVGLGRGGSGTAHAELCMMAGRIELANRLLRAELGGRQACLAIHVNVECCLWREDGERMGRLLARDNTWSVLAISTLAAPERLMAQ